MLRLTADDGTLLAILGTNPATSHWKRLVGQIADPVARQAALIIVGHQEAITGQPDPAAARLAAGVQDWARTNRTMHPPALVV